MMAISLFKPVLRAFLEPFDTPVVALSFDL